MSPFGSSPGAVYPRARGGAAQANNVTYTLRGLSPRTRGSPYESPPRVSYRRSIPAHAGEPSRAGGDSFSTGVYIPAHAGEPPHRRRRTRSTAVYPRARGGASSIRTRGKFIRGLSPRTRGSRGAAGGGGPHRGSIPAHAGEPTHPPRPPVLEGSIPAHAGEPSENPHSRKVDTVYPRARGGANGGHVYDVPPDGLSPRTRGSRAYTMNGTTWMRSIPAHAGEPLPRSPGSRQPPVYPRARGGAMPHHF